MTLETHHVTQKRIYAFCKSVSMYLGIQKDARDFETLTVLFNRLATG